MKQRPVAFALFAHPDDEAFGPSGTIALLSQTHDVYLVCATKGEAGENHSGKGGSLLKMREEELKNSADILGVKRVFFLGFKDGTLCNNLYHKAADKIQKLVGTYKPFLFLTVEPRGVSGHIDHIFVSMVSSFVYKNNQCIKELWYYCIDRLQSVGTRQYFIYFPPGYTKEEITKTVDVSSVWNKKVSAIKAHMSQSKDGGRVLLQQNILYIARGFRRVEHFITLSK